jgi:GTPase SAR1 family protein
MANRLMERISSSRQLILVALKCDLRDDPATIEKLTRQGKNTIVYEEGLAVARRINASRYLGVFSSVGLDIAHSDNLNRVLSQT